MQWDVSGLFGAVPLQHKSFKNGKVVGTGLTPTQFNQATQVCIGCQVFLAVHAAAP
jgi:hypothetical protein